jgi:hypothetical protein
MSKGIAADAHAKGGICECLSRENPEMNGAVLCLPFLIDMRYNRAAVFVTEHKYTVIVWEKQPT